MPKLIANSNRYRPARSYTFQVILCCFVCSVNAVNSGIHKALGIVLTPCSTMLCKKQLVTPVKHLLLGNLSVKKDIDCKTISAVTFKQNNITANPCFNFFISENLYSSAVTAGYPIINADTVFHQRSAL